MRFGILGCGYWGANHVRAFSSLTEVTQLVGPASSDEPSISYRHGETTGPHIDCAEPLVVAARDFVRCCQTGETPVADGLAGLSGVAVLEASDRSLREGGAPIAVDIPTVNRVAEARTA